MIRNAILLLGGNMGVASLKFLRNVMVARLLSVEDFGVASTFSIIFALVEMLGAFGLDRLLVQARDGEDPRMQSTLHLMQLLRGVLMAALLYGTAGPLAVLMGVPGVAWGFQLMALIPLLQGFVHLDMSRAQRSMNFVPLMKVKLGGEVLPLLAIYPLFLLFNDYRVVLGALLLQQALILIFSHMFAERRYCLGMDREVLVRALRFGWPVILNAFLMFGIFQGDRIIVANRLGAADLGIFSLAFMLTFMSTNVLVETLNRLFLPKLSALQDASESFDRLALLALQAGLVAGLAVAAGFSLFGPDLVLIVFGQKYAEAVPLLTWLAVMQAIRIAKMGVSVVSTAKARNDIPLIANIPRVLLLPVAWLALGSEADMIVVVWFAILGEVLGLALSLFFLRTQLGITLRPMLLPLMAWVGVLVLLSLEAFLRPPVAIPFGNFRWFEALIVLVVLASVFSMREVRFWLAGRRRVR